MKQKRKNRPRTNHKGKPGNNHAPTTRVYNFNGRWLTKLEIDKLKKDMLRNSELDNNLREKLNPRT